MVRRLITNIKAPFRVNKTGRAVTEEFCAELGYKEPPRSLIEGGRGFGTEKIPDGFHNLRGETICGKIRNVAARALAFIQTIGGRLAGRYKQNSAIRDGPDEQTETN